MIPDPLRMGVPRPNRTYPMAALRNSTYAQPLGYNHPTEVLSGYDTPVNPATGEELPYANFAEGGSVPELDYYTTPYMPTYDDTFGAGAGVPAASPELIAYLMSGMGSSGAPVPEDNYVPVKSTPYVMPERYGITSLGTQTNTGRPNAIGPYIDYLNDKFSRGPSYATRTPVGGGSGGSWAMPGDFPVVTTGGGGSSSGTSGSDILRGILGGLSNPYVRDMLRDLWARFRPQQQQPQPTSVVNPSTFQPVTFDPSLIPVPNFDFGDTPEAPTNPNQVTIESIDGSEIFLPEPTQSQTPVITPEEITDPMDRIQHYDPTTYTPPTFNPAILPVPNFDFGSQPTSDVSVETVEGDPIELNEGPSSDVFDQIQRYDPTTYVPPPLDPSIFADPSGSVTIETDNVQQPTDTSYTSPEPTTDLLDRLVNYDPTTYVPPPLDPSIFADPSGSVTIETEGVQQPTNTSYNPYTGSSIPTAAVAAPVIAGGLGSLLGGTTATIGLETLAGVPLLSGAGTTAATGAALGGAGATAGATGTAAGATGSLGGVSSLGSALGATGAFAAALYGLSLLADQGVAPVSDPVARAYGTTTPTMYAYGTPEWQRYTDYYEATKPENIQNPNFKPGPGYYETIKLLEEARALYSKNATLADDPSRYVSAEDYAASGGAFGVPDYYSATPYTAPATSYSDPYANYTPVQSTPYTVPESYSDPYANYTPVQSTPYTVPDTYSDPYAYYDPYFYGYGYASGGMTSLPEYKAGGNFLKGPGDGMSDHIPANIDGQQEARLSTEEFVIPADVVSHLGNGSSEAGAKKLYEMMDRVRMARTGTKQQGRQINPDKFLKV